jgi:hypothetical protein
VGIALTFSPSYYFVFRASKLYLSANELVEGVALTANDPEDQRKLQAYMHSLMEKHNTCKQRAAELLIYS